MTRTDELKAGAPRLLIGLAGLVLMGVGAIELLEFDLVDLLWVGFWLAAGVVLHDGVLAPATSVLGSLSADRLSADRLSADRRRLLVIAAVSVGSLTLLALPLILQQDGVAGNSSLLGRNYLVGWVVACALVLIGATIATVVGRVRAKRTAPKSTAAR
ncbi:MAG: hypothetical protein ACR2JG_07460 [Geodermatophilaceae bacterium]